MVFMILTSSVFAHQDLKGRIYKTFFEDLRYAFISVTIPSGITFITVDELEIIKESMKDENYHFLFVHLNSMKRLEILYSLRDRIWIARKYDVYPGSEKSNSLVITVYDIKLPETVALILEKHEKLLPEESSYLTSWSWDYPESLNSI